MTTGTTPSSPPGHAKADLPVGVVNAVMITCRMRFIMTACPENDLQDARLSMRDENAVAGQRILAEKLSVIFRQIEDFVIGS